MIKKNVSLEKNKYEGFHFYFENGKPDYSNFEIKKEALDSLMRLTGNAIYVKDLFQNSYKYLGGQSVHTSGYELEELYQMGEHIYAYLISEEDMPFVKEVEKAMYSFILHLSPNRKEYPVFHASYRYRHSSSKLVPIYFRVTPFLFDDAINILMMMGKLSLAKKHYRKFAFVEMTDTNERFYFDEKEGEFIKDEPISLTNMEKEILSFCGRGFTEKSIGEELHISHNTVKSHKRNIITKLKVNNISEAHNLANSQRLI